MCRESFDFCLSEMEAGPGWEECGWSGGGALAENRMVFGWSVPRPTSTLPPQEPRRPEPAHEPCARWRTAGGGTASNPGACGCGGDRTALPKAWDHANEPDRRSSGSGRRRGVQRELVCLACSCGWKHPLEHSGPCRGMDTDR